MTTIADVSTYICKIANTYMQNFMCSTDTSKPTTQFITFTSSAVRDINEYLHKTMSTFYMRDAFKLNTYEYSDACIRIIGFKMDLNENNELCVVERSIVIDKSADLDVVDLFANEIIESCYNTYIKLHKLIRDVVENALINEIMML